MSVHGRRRARSFPDESFRIPYMAMRAARPDAGDNPVPAVVRHPRPNGHTQKVPGPMSHHGPGPLGLTHQQPDKRPIRP